MRKILKNRNFPENIEKNIRGKYFLNLTKLKTSDMKGITLIALVITVIVLLILAGISISAITGNESVMEKAKQAKTANENANELDSIKLAIVEGIAKGNNGELESNDLKTALVGIVTDTSMITGVGPWQVTGSQTGTKYLIKQSYDVIPMPENTGTKIEMGVKAGDYVNYTAGNWTQEDIESLKNLYSGENIPDSNNPYTFGGFKVGQSKDVGIIQGENNASVQDNEHAGWRVLSFNDDGSVNIIHAGCPEWYYQATHYRLGYDGGPAVSAQRSAARGQYILDGTKIENAPDISFENIQTKNWKIYEDNNYCISNSARSIKYDEIRKLTNYYFFTNHWFLLVGVDFVTEKGYTGSGGLMGCHVYNNNTMADTSNYIRDKAAGIRPVVTLKAECLFQNINDENTTTHNTKETAWNLVI
ncbi:MAG: hypothetical protein IKF38_03215 [Clostridia bacterium]|nr:hypothetical protein [Clostridia bacterium]